MPTLRAVALILSGAVFLVGVGRFQSFLAPPDYVYVGLLWAAPVASALALVLPGAPDEEPLATLRAAAYLLNASLLAFVAWLFARLSPSARRDQALWIAILAIAPFVNAIAVRASGSRARGSS